MASPKHLRVAFAFLGALTMCGGAASADSHSAIFVGVLENIESNRPPYPKGTPLDVARAHVRIAFYKDGDNWVAMNSHFYTPTDLQHANDTYPSQVDWTVVFDGKKIGRISSKKPDKIQYYSDIGIQSISTDAGHIPIVRIGISDFGYIAGKSKSRPLLLVSAGNFRDPDNWKPTTLSAAERSAAIREFRKLVPNSERCQVPEQNPVTRVPYADNQVKSLKAYRSKDGTALFGLQLKDARENCGWFDDSTFYDYWFVIEKGRKPRELGDQMQPMEAADLDNSGKSKWVFHTSRGENEDGYAIYWNNFSKSSAYSWNYH